MAAFLARRMIGDRSSKLLWLTNSRLSTSSGRLVARAFSSSLIPITATLLHGDGIGPEIAESVKQVFDVAEAPIEWEEHYVCTEEDPRTHSFLTWECLDSVRKNKVGLKGPMEMPLPSGPSPKGFSLTWKEIKFYAKVRHFISFPGYTTRYSDVDLIIIRENTQGEYNGIEHQVVKGVVQSINIITREASLRVAEYAFHYAKTQARKKVSVVHKTSVMQKTNGLFLKCCQEVASEYPEIIYEEFVVENCCMMLVNNPSRFDVLVMPNLYGDIISNLCAGMVGGLNLTPSCSIGEDGVALAEVVHDSMHDLAGKNLANPTAMLLSAVMMLRHLELNEKAEQIHKAVVDTIAEDKHRTVDLGGTSTTTEFTNAICDHLLNQ